VELYDINLPDNMTEGLPRPRQPKEQPAGPRPELPTREVFKLPSQAILDGIWQGQIKDPNAMRAYVLRQRTEFLQAHPDREAELDGPGEIGRWHRLVYSDTAEEYRGLAALCDREVHGRTAGLTASQLDEPANLHGVVGFSLMADLWRTRADKEASERPTAGQPEPPRIRPHENQSPQTLGERPNYDRRHDYEVLDGINSGKFTETEAVHVYVRKSLQSLRDLYTGDELQAHEAEYAEVVMGEPQAMIHFSLTQAQEYLCEGAPAAVSLATTRSQPAGTRWPDASLRWRHRAVRTRTRKSQRSPKRFVKSVRWPSVGADLQTYFPVAGFVRSTARFFRLYLATSLHHYAACAQSAAPLVRVLLLPPGRRRPRPRLRLPPGHHSQRLFSGYCYTIVTGPLPRLQHQASNTYAHTSDHRSSRLAPEASWSSRNLSPALRA
jgi:hypothetical protein